LPAARRLGLIIVGLQAAIPPQVTVASIAVLNGLAWWEKVMGITVEPITE
jgi:hypothetical protein